MLVSDGDAHLGGNVYIGGNITNRILISLNLFCAQSFLHECHMSFCMTWSVFEHDITNFVETDWVESMCLLEVTPQHMK